MYTKDGRQGVCVKDESTTTEIMNHPTSGDTATNDSINNTITN